MPSLIAVKYYRQRASAGLIIIEATQISPETGQSLVVSHGWYMQ